MLTCMQTFTLEHMQHTIIRPSAQPCLSCPLRLTRPTSTSCWWVTVWPWWCMVMTPRCPSPWTTCWCTAGGQHGDSWVLSGWKVRGVCGKRGASNMAFKPAHQTTNQTLVTYDLHSVSLRLRRHTCPRCRAVSRGARRAFLVGDMPFGSYETSVRDAVMNATRMLKEGGMDAVKLEGRCQPLAWPSGCNIAAPLPLD